MTLSELSFRLSATIVLSAVSLSPEAHAQVCAGISEASDTPLTSVRIVSGLVRPVLVTAPAGDVERVFIVEQDGKIKIRKNGAVLPAAFLDITPIVRSPADIGGNEEGLLGLAFHPDYATNGWFFVYHTNSSGNNVVARYTRSAGDPDVADPASRVEVITFSHPGATNHNGGMIAFGPNDGYLYIGTGDGGGGCDPAENGQNGATHLGKMLRIDVDALPYGIPPDNPFVGGANNDEIWSLGLRNPWRWSFDRATGDLYIGDVGQARWEEIDYVPAPDAGKAANFGWDNYEGTVCPNPSCTSETSTCTFPNNTLPVLVFANDSSTCSVTGGYVYRGCRMPALHGTYFYADYCAAFIRSFEIAGGVPVNQITRTGELAPGGGLTINSITSFGEDARGEIYVVDQGGEIFKIVPVLSNLEVSGAGASSLLLSRDGDWTWENLQATSDHPVAVYEVFRSFGNGSGVFDCIHQQATTVWVGGDPVSPASGELFSYLVTATNAAGARTNPGTASNGAARLLSPSACP